MMKPTPHAYGVDDIALALRLPEDSPSARIMPHPTRLFPVRFPQWVTSSERYWVILAEHRSDRCAL